MTLRPANKLVDVIHALRKLVLAPLLVFSFCLCAKATTFKNPVLIPTTTDPLGPAAGDFNGDGKPDLVYVDGSNTYTLHVLLGNGDGTFTHGQDMPLPAWSIAGLSSHINVADINRDGHLDLIFGAIILLGNGDGTFQQPVASGAPALPAKIGIGDVNGDGVLDLVAPDVNYRVDVLLGSTTGSFQLGTTLPDGTSPRSVYLADVNGDGHLDVVTLGMPNNGATVFLGNGDGTFRAGVNYNTLSIGGIGFSLLEDIDGDGHPDLVGSSLGQLVIFKGQADGTFVQVPLSIPAYNGAVGAADLNGDGIPDLILSTSAGIGVLLGQGNFSFLPILFSVSGGTGLGREVGLAQADFNQDGHLDLALSVDGGIALSLGKGDGTFPGGDVYDVRHQIGAATVADFNGDNLPDIAVSVAAPFPRLLLAQGAGKFQLGPDLNASSSYGGQSYPSFQIAAGDFNGDGNADLFLLAQQNAGVFGAPTLLFGDGRGGFTPPAQVANASNVIADLNGDGKSDMATIDSSFFPGSILVSLGNANESFSTVTTVLRLGGQIAAVGDLNRDGKPDLLINVGGVLQIWLARGDGTFAYSNSVDLTGFSVVIGNFVSTAIADFDGDGNPDIALVPNSPDGAAPLPLQIAFLYGNGDGTFSVPTFVSVSHSYSRLTVADLNQDHRPDLVLNDGVGIAVLLNLGNRAFAPEERYVAGTSIGTLQAVDVNGDGFPDLVVTNSNFVVANANGNTVVVLLNDPNGIPPGGLPITGTLSASPEPSPGGQPFTANLSVAPLSGATVPTGTATFSINGVFAATVPLASGQASYNFASPTPNVYTISAAYNGDKNYAPAVFSQTHVVSPPVYPTTTVLTATPTTLFTSQTVHLSATTTSTGGQMYGTVSFEEGTKTIGASNLDRSGVASIDTSLLSAGSHSIVAKYFGQPQTAPNSPAVFSPSQSAAVTVTVNATATATTLKASSSTAIAGSVVTFSALVSSPSAVPFGGVSFYDGTRLLGTAALLADGTTSFSIASLGTGQHSVTAMFNANAMFAASSSSPLGISISSSVAVPTAVALSTSYGTTSGEIVQLQAAVEYADGGQPHGRVVFLDNGAVLGIGEVDSAGVAHFALPVVSGRHSIMASFTGDSQYAPSVSPELLEMLPGTGVGFTLEANTHSVLIRGSADVRLTVSPLGAFSGDVLLGCGPDLPANYICSFSPSSITRGGVSQLTIERTSARPIRNPGMGLTASLAMLLGLAFIRQRHVASGVTAILVCLFLLGCAVRGADPTAALHVLRIQATSGSGGSTTMHTTEITVSLKAP